MRRKHQKGHALLELALSAAVMVSCLTGTFRFGYTFYVYNELVTAVGNAGRYAATRSYRAATAEDLERGKAAIRNMAVYGNPSPARDAVPVVPNLTPENVRVTFVAEPGARPEAVDVSIVNYSVGTTLGPLTLDKRPNVEFPFVGRYAPQEREQ
jgi:Flp pilus assembly protein TadG